MNDFLSAVSATPGPVIIFGASALGRVAAEALDILGIPPAYFCDNDPAKQNAPFCHLPVHSFRRLQEEDPGAIVIVAAGRYRDEIRAQLTAAGFHRLYTDADVLDCLNLQQVPLSRLRRILWRLADLGKLNSLTGSDATTLNLPRLNVVVTARCTLRCRHCSSLMPWYARPRDFATEEILDSLSRLLDVCAHIYHVEVLGGEPFLNPDLGAIVRYLLDSGKVLHLDLITNGTLQPDDERLTPLAHPDLTVVINRYATHSPRAEELAARLNRLGIDHRINRHWSWADLGGFESRERTEKQLGNLFSRCHFNSCTELLGHYLYRCPRSSHGTTSGMIPAYPEDRLDLSAPDLTDSDLPRRLREFLFRKPWLHACDHCDGNTADSLTLAPALQLQKGEAP